MPRDARETRARLVRAAEHRFARDGVFAARLSDIVRDAEQANDSAVGYHFGSRRGLLAEIVGSHFTRMDAQRVVPPSLLDITELVAIIVEPTAELLDTPEGRDFLRIMAQLTDGSGEGIENTNAFLCGSVLGQQLTLLSTRLSERCSPEVAEEKVGLLVTFLTSALAERARSIETEAPPRLSHARFVDHLVAALAAAMKA